MKHLILLFLLTCTIETFCQVKVSGYTRNNGTHVQPYYRSTPDGNPYNNYSFPGNVNPYTGKVATGDPLTYLNNYYNKTSSYTNNYTLNNSTGSVYYIARSNVNIRSGPSTSNSIITTLTYSDIVHVVETQNDYPWYRVYLTYYDDLSKTFKTSYGYVYGTYLSSSNPNSYSSDINEYLNSKSTDLLSSNYIAGSSSSINNYNNNGNSNSFFSPTAKTNTYNPYGDGNGKINFWTTLSDNGYISIYIDSVYQGKLVYHFNSTGPDDCDSEGTLSIIKKAGRYKLTAKSFTGQWEEVITIKENECTLEKVFQ